MESIPYPIYTATNNSTLGHRRDTVTVVLADWYSLETTIQGNSFLYSDQTAF